MQQQPSVLLVASDGAPRYGFGNGHPFGPDRQDAFMRELRRSRCYGQLRIVEPRLAEREEIESFHRREYVDLVVQKSRDGRGYLDAGDTPAFKGVYEASSFVVGGTLLAVEEIMGGTRAPCVHSHRRAASCLARACRRFLRVQ